MTAIAPDAGKLHERKPASKEAAIRRILVVDDPQTQAFFRQTFPARTEASPYELDFAANGDETLERAGSAVAEGRPYAMVFVGSLPGSGRTVLETGAGLLESDPDVHVVLCGGVNGSLGGKLEQSDRCVILRKPFEALEIKQLLAALAAKRELARIHRESNHRWHESEQCHLFVADELETRVFDKTAELVSTRLRLEHLLRSSPAVIYSLKVTNPPTFTFVSDNFAALFGHQPEELLANPDFWAGQLHPEDVALVTAARARRFQAGHLAVDFRFRHKDGTYRWVQDNARVIRDRLGTPVEVIGSLSDITERKGSEKELQLLDMQLRQAQKLEAIGQLGSGIAHEINTPIQYVGDNTRFVKDAFSAVRDILVKHRELLAAAKAGTLTLQTLAAVEKHLAAADVDYLLQQVPSAIDETLEGVERVSKIVQAMKEFSQPRGNEKAMADLNHAIESTTTVARNEWKYVSDLTLDLNRDLPPVSCFLGEFNQVILNLVINAVHAIGDVVKQQPGTKGTITISTRRDGDFAEVRVADTGTGIAEEHRAHIFEPYFTTKAMDKGTGQGLSLVYGSIVKKHGGTVTFETEVGKGTTFIVRLPLAAT